MGEERREERHSGWGGMEEESSFLTSPSVQYFLDGPSWDILPT